MRIKKREMALPDLEVNRKKSPTCRKFKFPTIQRHTYKTREKYSKKIHPRLILSKFNMASALFDLDEEPDSSSEREAFHTNPDLVKFLLRCAVPSTKLDIRPSRVASGSGLFATVPVEAGCEIYRSDPVLLCAEKATVCQWCLEDMADHLSRGSDAPGKTRKCSACHSARYCSKVCDDALPG